VKHQILAVHAVIMIQVVLLHESTLIACHCLYKVPYKHAYAMFDVQHMNRTC
jgi:hypothetical protein